MTEERKAAPIALRRRQASQPSFDRIGEVAAAVSSLDNQYPPAAREAATHDPEPMAVSADKDASAHVSPARPASASSAGRVEHAETKPVRPAEERASSRRVRVRCEPEELRALRAYAALQGIPLSDLLSEALKPLVGKAIAAMRR